MFASLLDFVSKAARGAVECSIENLRELPELSGLGPLGAFREVERVCKDAELECNPSLTDGELADMRVFTTKRSGDQLENDVDQAIRKGEGHKVEFKQTLGLHLKRRDNDANATVDQLFASEIIHEIIKTVVAFLNADGGTLLVGVCDDGSLFGIENEYPYVGGEKNLDAWALKLNSALEGSIPDYRTITGFVTQAIIERDGHRICVINVEPRRDRICVCRRSNKEGEDEIVYRRSGNSTLKLQARDIEALVLDRLRHRDVIDQNRPGQ